MLLGQVAPVFAVDEPATEQPAQATGSVTVNAASKGLNYSIYQLFTGDFKTADGKTTFGNVQFSSEACGEVLVDTINGYMTGKEGWQALEDASAYDVAKVIADTSELHSTDFSNKLATALENANVKGITKPAEAETVTFDGLDYGYYLIASQKPDDVEAVSGTHTSAIMLPVNGDVTVETKTSTPTVEKTMVKDESANPVYDSAGTMGIWKDEKGELHHSPLKFRLKGTVSKNISDFDSYMYQFADTLPKGIRLVGEDPSSLTSTVSITGIDKNTSQITTKKIDKTHSADEKGTTITWGWNNLKSALENEYGFDISPSSAEKIEIIVDYEITLSQTQLEELFDTQDEIQNPLNNTAYVQFSNDPRNSQSTDKTPGDEVKTYSFSLDIHKVDQTGKNPLNGAEFTLTDDQNNTIASLVTTDDESQFTFTGLKENVKYTLTETKAPDGYKKIEPIEFQIEPVYEDEDGDGNKEFKSVTVKTISNPSGALTSGIEDVTFEDGKDTNLGKVVVIEGNVINIEGPSMPLTGQAGIWTGVAVGGIVIAMSAYGILRKKKESE